MVTHASDFPSHRRDQTESATLQVIVIAHHLPLLTRARNAALMAAFVFPHC